MTEVDEYISVKRSCFNDFNDFIVGVYKLTKKDKQIAPVAPWANFKNINDINDSNDYEYTLNKKIQDLEGEDKYIQQKKETLKSKRNEGFYILSNKNHVSNYLKKTKFCNIMVTNGQCNRKVCDFAHTIQEYNFPECVFKDNCKKKTEGCLFKHPKESVEEFKQRTNFKYPSNIK